jgi:hypothetical protein
MQVLGDPSVTASLDTRFDMGSRSFIDFGWLPFLDFFLEIVQEFLI